MSPMTADVTPGPADEPHNCPHCGVSLLASLIPEKHLDSYGKSRWYKREIGQYDMVKDRTIGYKCPDCGKNPMVSP